MKEEILKRHCAFYADTSQVFESKRDDRIVYTSSVRIDVNRRCEMYIYNEKCKK